MKKECKECIFYQLDNEKPFCFYNDHSTNPKDVCDDFMYRNFLGNDAPTEVLKYRSMIANIKTSKKQTEFNRIVAMTGTIIAIVMVLNLINNIVNQNSNSWTDLFFLIGFGGFILIILIGFLKKLLKEK